MKSFELFKLNEYESYILLLSNDDIYFLYDKIKKEAKTEKILVDMFYRNGYSFNRFIELIFAEDNNVKTRILNPRCVSENIKGNTHDYFVQNKNLLSKSTLSTSIKNFMCAS